MKPPGVVTVLDSDAENVYAVLTGRELNPKLEIIARAADESAEKKLLRAGADRVISPYRIGGMRMVLSVLKPTVTSFLDLVMDYKRLNVEIEEVRVAARSSYCGKKLKDTHIRKDLNLIIIAVATRRGPMVFNPGPETVVHGLDTLVAMGGRESLTILRREAGADWTGDDSTPGS